MKRNTNIKTINETILEKNRMRWITELILKRLQKELHKAEESRLNTEKDISEAITGLAFLSPLRAAETSAAQVSIKDNIFDGLVSRWLGRPEATDTKNDQWATVHYKGVTTYLFLHCGHLSISELYGYRHRDLYSVCDRTEKKSTTIQIPIKFLK